MKRHPFTIGLFLTVCLGFIFGPRSSSSAQTTTLKLNQPLTRTIKAGETQEFQIALKAGEFMQAEALQKGVDVVLRLYSPDGQQLLERDSPNSTDGPEPLSYLADVVGIYKLAVIVWEQAEAKEGNYDIELKALRQPTTQDRKRIMAETLFRDALVFGNQAKALRAEKKTDEAEKASSQSNGKYRDSLALWRGLGDKYWLALTLTGINSLKSDEELAALYEEMGDKKRAQGLWLKIGKFHADYAQYLRERGQKAEAVTTLLEALEAIKKADRLNELGVAVLENLGQVYLDLGELKKAKDNYQEAFQIAKKGGDLGSVINCSQNLERISRMLKAKAISVELVVQTGHASTINSTSIALDGKTMASGSDDKTIKLWDTVTGTELQTFTGHTEPVNSVAIAPDGKTLASGSDDRTVKLWDIVTGTELRTFTGYTASVNSVAFAPDGKTLASGSDNGTVKLWDIVTGAELRTLNRIVDLVAFSPDGKTLAIGDNGIRLLDLTSGTELFLLAGRVRSMAFAPDGRTLVSLSKYDSKIVLWDITTGAVLRIPSGEAIIPGGADLRTLSGQAGISVAFMSDSRILVSGSQGRNIILWDAITGNELFKLIGHVDSVESTAFSDDGRTLTSRSDSIIKLWDIVSDTKYHSLYGGKTSYKNFLRSIVYSRDGKTLASVSSDKAIKFWDVTAGSELHSLSGHIDSVNSCAFSPDGKMLASGSSDKIIKIWDVTSGSEVRSLTGHTGSVNLIAFSPDGKALASDGSDGTIKIWDVTSGSEVRSLTWHSMAITSIAFSPDGKTLASGSSTGIILLWDVDSGTEIRTLSGHTHRVTSIVFAPDGKILASNAGDGTLMLWDVLRGGTVLSIPNHLPEWIAFDGRFPFSEIRRDGLTYFGRFTLKTINGRAIVLVLDGGQINLINYDTGERLCSLIALDDEDWAVVTPDGLFDASNGAMKLMHFVISGIEEGYAVVAFEQMQERYYQPNLLAKLLGFDSTPQRTVAPFTGEKLYPKVEYRWQENGSTKLEIKLRDRGGGIGEVSVLINGNTWIKDVRLPGFDKDAKEAVFTVDLKDAPFLVSEPDHVEVVARNAEGWLTNARSSGVVYDAETEAAKPIPELWVIVGGVSDYEGMQLDLNFAAKDAEDFANAIRLGGYRLFGAERVHLQLLTTNSQDPKLLPTKDNFRRVFTEFQRAKPNDVLLVYLSGHGVAFRVDGDKVLYSYLTQTATSGDLKDSDVRNRVAITSDELMDWIRGIKTNKNVLLFDTCAAGAFADNMNLAIKKDDAGEYLDNQKAALNQLRSRTAFHILMGSAADKPSYETSQFNQGLLTYALLEGIKFGAVNNERTVRVGDLFQYTRERVPKLADAIGNRNIQTPQISAPQGDNLPLLLMDQNDAAAIRLERERPFVMRPRLVNQDNRRDLEIERRLIQRLKAASQPAKRGDATQGLPFNFLDTVELPIAITPNGDYKYEGERITVNLDLLRGDQTVKTLTITGNRNDLDGLIEKIIAELGAALEKIPKLVADPPE